MSPSAVEFLRWLVVNGQPWAVGRKGPEANELHRAGLARPVMESGLVLVEPTESGRRFADA